MSQPKVKWSRPVNPDVEQLYPGEIGDCRNALSIALDALQQLAPCSCIAHDALELITRTQPVLAGKALEHSRN